MCKASRPFLYTQTGLFMSSAYYTTEISKENNNMFAVHQMENCAQIIEISDSALRYSTVELLKIKATIPIGQNQFLMCKDIMIDTMTRMKAILTSRTNAYSDNLTYEGRCFQNGVCIGIVCGKVKGTNKLILEGYQISGVNEITDFLRILDPQELEHLGYAETLREAYDSIDRLINDARHDIKDILTAN